MLHGISEQIICWGRTFFGYPTIRKILEPNETVVVLTGKKELREAIHVILNDLDNFSHPIIIIEANDLAGRGALLAGKKKGLLRKEG